MKRKLILRTEDIVSVEARVIDWIDVQVQNYERTYPTSEGTLFKKEVMKKTSFTRFKFDDSVLWLSHYPEVPSIEQLLELCRKDGYDVAYFEGDFGTNMKVRFGPHLVIRSIIDEGYVQTYVSNYKTNKKLLEVMCDINSQLQTNRFIELDLC